MKITKNTKIAEILKKDPRAAEALIDAGMHCVGCPMAMQESLEMGCLAHGMEEKEIRELIKKLNKKKKEK
jgi:hydroxylamine reductase